VCLWAHSDAARKRFGHAVDHRNLPLSAETIQMLDALIAQYDTSLDWNDPGGGSIWNVEAVQNFSAAAQKGLAQLRAELTPPEYAFIDESTLQM
jgi:hypothetical protein